MNRDEIALESEHLDLLEALTAAKEAHRDQPTDATRAALADAKSAIRAFREQWRSIRAAFAGAPAEGDGIATPATVATSVKIPKVSK
jgi:hypothetical protein